MKPASLRGLSTSLSRFAANVEYGVIRATIARSEMKIEKSWELIRIRVARVSGDETDREGRLRDGGRSTGGCWRTSNWTRVTLAL